MKNAVLLIGESGTGKSTSIRTLPHEKTFIINVENKPLPFRGSSKQYTPISADNPTGNYFGSDDTQKIIKIIDRINTNRPDIKYIVIDDFGYTLMNQFMRKALIKGYDKFSEIAKSAFDILDKLKELRSDLFCAVIMHSDPDQNGVYKPKTIGKMIDSYVTIEGKFTYVFHSLVMDKSYKFLTNYNGVHMAKTPIDMFPHTMDNDLLAVFDTINEYMTGEKNESI